MDPHFPPWQSLVKLNSGDPFREIMPSPGLHNLYFFPHLYSLLGPARYLSLQCPGPCCCSIVFPSFREKAFCHMEKKGAKVMKITAMSPTLNSALLFPWKRVSQKLKRFQKERACLTRLVPGSSIPNNVLTFCTWFLNHKV